MNYEVTIGIPVYKSAQYIEQTMLSALSQTFSNVEFLIVDDCGNDGSMEKLALIMSSHPRGNTIRVLHNDINRGVSYCRNRIIDEARGHYLFFMDSDDLIESDTISVLYKSLNDNKAQVAYGSYEIIDEENNSLNEIYIKPPVLIEGESNFATFVFDKIRIFHVSVCNILFDLDFLRNTGVRFIETSYWEDMAFSTELVVRVYKAVTVSNITYHYIHHIDSLSHRMKREISLRDEIINNITVLNYLKKKLLLDKNLSYVPYLCYNLEMYSFYLICNIIKKKHLICPAIPVRDMRKILYTPFSLIDILGFKSKRNLNLLFALICRAPSPLFLIIVKILGKIKKAI